MSSALTPLATGPPFDECSAAYMSVHDLCTAGFAPRRNGRRPRTFWHSPRPASDPVRVEDLAAVPPVPVQRRMSLG